MTGTAQLHAVRYPDQVTAADALAWFAARPAAAAGSREVIGYLLAPDRAEWFRCEGAVPHGPDGARDLAGAFEVCATDGAVQLRWVHQTSGHGRAVSLAEDATALPPGQAIPASPERRRLEGMPERVLVVTSTATSRWPTRCCCGCWPAPLLLLLPRRRTSHERHLPARPRLGCPQR